METSQLDLTSGTQIDFDGSSKSNVQTQLPESTNNVIASGVNESFNNAEKAILALREDYFLKICDAMQNNPQSILLPEGWIPQVICTGVKCIMWSQWKPTYLSIAKRIVLFSDMTIHVSIELDTKHTIIKFELRNLTTKPF